MIRAQDRCFLVFLCVLCGFTTHFTVNGQAAGDRPRCSGSTPVPDVTGPRLQRLRTLMTSNGIQAYIVPTSDAHLSEYVPDKDKFRQWLSGFTGSAGTAVVTATKAALWTDGRYFLQAEQELDCNWSLMKTGMPGVPSVTKWITEELSPSQNVSADQFIIDYDTWESYLEEFAMSSLNFRPASVDMADLAWGNDRPSFPDAQIFYLNTSYSGLTTDKKLSAIKSEMDMIGADALIITALDEVAWLTNLRGFDVPHTPVFLSFAIFEDNNLTVYIRNHSGRVSAEGNEALHTAPGACDGVPTCIPTTLKEYDEFRRDLPGVASRRSNIWLSPLSSYGVYYALGDPDRILLEVNPIIPLKAAKNAVEQRNMIHCNIKDSAALAEFYVELRKKVLGGKHVTEISASRDLEKIRRSYPASLGPSFGSISAFGSNAAIIHYHPTNESDTRITTDSLYLIDSGGQYLDGTTDVTRTLAFGTPTEQEKEAYTQVLQGAIDLASTVWVDGIYGSDLDPIARRWLWKQGLDYRHGTGHAIGFLLSVHENYNRIKIRGGGRCSRCLPLTEGFVLSDEPGYYEDGKFGIRLETDLLVVPADTKHQFGSKAYLGWQPLTLFPFEKKLIKTELLQQEQLTWLNWYHKQCREKTGKYLKDMGKTAAYEWILSSTEPISTSLVSGSNPMKPSLLVAMATVVLCLHL